MRRTKSKLFCGDSKKPVSSKAIKEWFKEAVGNDALVRAEIKVIIDDKENKQEVQNGKG